MSKKQLFYSKQPPRDALENSFKNNWFFQILQIQISFLWEKSWTWLGEITFEKKSMPSAQEITKQEIVLRTIGFFKSFKYNFPFFEKNL